MSPAWASFCAAHHIRVCEKKGLWNDEKNVCRGRCRLSRKCRTADLFCVNLQLVLCFQFLAQYRMTNSGENLAFNVRLTIFVRRQSTMKKSMVKEALNDQRISLGFSVCWLIFRHLSQHFSFYPRKM